MTLLISFAIALAIGVGMGLLVQHEVFATNANGTNANGTNGTNANGINGTNAGTRGANGMSPTLPKSGIFS